LSGWDFASPATSSVNHSRDNPVAQYLWLKPAGQSLKSAAYTFKDARDLVVLVVGYVYLRAIADEAHIGTAEAQVKTAQAFYDQASDRINAGYLPSLSFNADYGLAGSHPSTATSVAVLRGTLTLCQYRR
jgi:hypothetical protein